MTVNKRHTLSVVVVVVERSVHIRHQTLFPRLDPCASENSQKRQFHSPSPLFLSFVYLTVIMHGGVEPAPVRSRSSCQ